MGNSVFITGTSGYIGSRLIKRLDQLPYDRVYCLSRDQSACKSDKTIKTKNIIGGIEDIESYASYLAECDTVVHLAAATGKAKKEIYFKVNTEGTELLLDQCKKAGVRNFLHVSTIAVKYPDKSNYYYAQSKEEGECAVKTSGLNYIIVRPTIVIGKDSAIWTSLSKLARAPVTPLLGNGSARIQPIYIDDLVDCLVTILVENQFNNGVIELGGPDQVTFEAYLRQVHFAYNQKEARVVRFPLNMLKVILSALESRFQSILPVTAGQLSAFSNDGTIKSSGLYERSAVGMKGVDEMIKLVVGLEKRQAIDAQLDRECVTYTRYLVRQDPTEYIVEKYCDAHQYSEVLDDTNAPAFSNFLVRMSARNSFFTQLADAYTSIFYKRSLFRNKLVLLVAILESCAPTYPSFEVPDATNIVGVIFQMSLRTVGFVLALLLSTILLSPVRAVYALGARQSGER
jgi:nucleoside-diphosphate-sugar epimerase